MRSTPALVIVLVGACAGTGEDATADGGSTGEATTAASTSSGGSTGSSSTSSGATTATSASTEAGSSDEAGPDTTSGASATEGGSDESTGGACPPPPAALPSGPLARSEDNPMLMNGPEAYDFWKTGPRVVRKEGPTDYRIWYEAVADETYTTVAYATSEDGIDWTKVGVVLSPSASWEGNEVSPNSMLLEDGTYKLWYHAGGSQLVNRRIGMATSDDGMTWTKLDDPLLDLGAPGAFDDNQVAEPRVIRLADGYRMYYTGRNEATNLTSLGMATSDDGVVWTKDPTSPILDADAWGNFWGGAFFYEDGIWHLWHGTTDGNTSALEYMWSLDGIEWNDGPNNPVLEQNPDPGAADYGLVGDSVSGYRDGASYRIMYTGFNWNLFGSEGRFEGICLASIDAAC